MPRELRKAHLWLPLGIFVIFVIFASVIEPLKDRNCHPSSLGGGRGNAFLPNIVCILVTTILAKLYKPLNFDNVSKASKSREVKRLVSSFHSSSSITIRFSALQFSLVHLKQGTLTAWEGSVQLTSSLRLVVCKKPIVLAWKAVDMILLVQDQSYSYFLSS